MDIEKANYILGKAITGFQEYEIEDLSEAAFGGDDEDIERIVDEEEREAARRREGWDR
jgi:hypothetical protein